MTLSLDESLKRVISRSLQMYRDELLISDWKINKSLYHAIVHEELELIEQLFSEIQMRWEKAIIVETFTHIKQPLMLKQVKDTFEKLKQNPSSIIKGFTVQGQSVEVKFNGDDSRFELLIDGEWICQAKSVDLASSLFISIVD